MTNTGNMGHVQQNTAPERDSLPDWFALIAHQRGLPSTWGWFHAEFKGDETHGVFVIRGAVCTERFKRGPRKGRLNWSKRTDEREIIVTRDELQQAKAAWETDTGRCFNCGGTGQTVASVHVSGERTYRPCKRCRP